MKIALIGYGKMGHAIEKIARERGHEIVAVIDIDNVADIHGPAFASADVAIEFTTPATAPTNIIEAARAGVPVVCGSTGWGASRAEVEQAVTEAGGTLLVSSNFSIGVNILFALNRRLAAIMNNLPQYRPQLDEVHHIHKLDHPSGTAITLAEGLIDNVGRIDRWAETAPASAPADVLPVECERRGEVPGIHTIEWTSPVDTITISHSAKSREGFALGAVMAAEWAASRKGILSLDQMLSDLNII